jgi:hypothetical protein
MMALMSHGTPVPGLIGAALVQRDTSQKSAIAHAPAGGVLRHPDQVADGHRAPRLSSSHHLAHAGDE